MQRLVHHRLFVHVIRSSHLLTASRSTTIDKTLTVTDSVSLTSLPFQSFRYFSHLQKTGRPPLPHRKIQSVNQLFFTSMSEGITKPGATGPSSAPENGTRQARVFCLPSEVRGMKVLNREAFEMTVNLPVLHIPCEQFYKTVKVLRDSILKRPGIQAIDDVPQEDPQYKKIKRVIFDPDKFKSIKELPEKVIERFEELQLKEEFQMVEFRMKYENWKYDEIFDAVLPENEQKVAGFSRIGHILHLNLKEYHHDYRKLIGQVLLDKFSTVRTVVNKVNTIDNTFRNFAMEVLAGDDDLITVCKENGFQFKMDFSKVFWNPRLGTEHERIFSQLNAGDVVYDVMAGIGPFSVPAAKKKCTVLANDLNPESFKWLKVNMELNKTKGAECFNLDGRCFIREELKRHLLTQWQSDKQCNMHVVMNLPALAIEFLDAFYGLFTEDELPSQNISFPLVHCYSFCKNPENIQDDMRLTATKHLGCEVPEDTVVRIVRNVAPGKEMVCVEFKLNRSILLGSDEPPDKKIKVSDA